MSDSKLDNQAETRIPKHTPCKDCVFAVYDEANKTQIECSQNLYPIYESLGCKIIEAYDNDKEFNIVEGRHCLYHRNSAWLSQQTVSAEEAVSSEVCLRYSAVIFIAEDKTFEDAKTTLLSIFNSEILPIEIIVVYQNNPRQLSTKNNLPAYTDDIRWCQENLRGVKFQIEYPTNSPSSHESLNIAIRKVRNSYMLLQAGHNLGPGTISTINYAITKQIRPIAAAKHASNQFHELFAFKKFHEYVGGFGVKTVQEKIDNLVEDEKNTEDGSLKCQQIFLTY